MLGQLLAPFLVSVEQHLRITLGGKAVPGREQLQPQGLIVLDFPIEYQHFIFGLIDHGLGAAARVDDGKPPEAESRAI